MTVKIKTEKIVVHGQPCYKIVGFKGISLFSDLPEEYLVAPPCFFALDKKSVVVTIPSDKKVKSYRMDVGDIFMRDYFVEVIIPTLEEAGNRLHDIRMKNKWVGNCTFEI